MFVVGWFQHWGEAAPHRPVKDQNFATARWIMNGGSMFNYYMCVTGTR